MKILNINRHKNNEEIKIYIFTELKRSKKLFTNNCYKESCLRFYNLWDIIHLTAFSDKTTQNFISLRSWSWLVTYKKSIIKTKYALVLYSWTWHHIGDFTSPTTEFYSMKLKSKFCFMKAFIWLQIGKTLKRKYRTRKVNVVSFPNQSINESFS